MDLGLDGKSTIITGGSGGIGRGLVLGFAEEGANVVVATRDGAKGQEVADAAKDMPGEVLVVPTDVTDLEAVEKMVEKTESTFGPVDVLVNNAGGVFHPTPFLDKSVEDSEWEVNLNVWGVHNCTRAAGRSMVDRGTGSVRCV